MKNVMNSHFRREAESRIVVPKRLQKDFVKWALTLQGLRKCT